MDTPSTSRLVAGSSDTCPVCQSFKHEGDCLPVQTIPSREQRIDDGALYDERGKSDMVKRDDEGWRQP